MTLERYVDEIDDWREIEVEITGEVCRTEPYLGLRRAYVEGVTAAASGKPIDLTARETDAAIDLLLEASER